MNRSAPLTHFAWLWPLALCGSLQAQPLVGKCLPASFGRASAGPVESYEDEYGHYTAFKGVQFGESLQGAAYVGVASQRVMLASLRFHAPKGPPVQLASDELALSRAVAYVSHQYARVICVLGPLSGLGSSGSFQRVAALIAVRKPRGQSPLRVAGALVKVD
ncbi:MAG: hypothetical protein RI907_3277 [Pseudomonadota bacterium]|jgi:hypothetical protein